jgi:hypothetical protein
MRLFEPYLLQIAHRAGVVMSREGMLQGPAARAGGLGDVSKSDRLLGLGLHVGDGPAKCPRRHRPGPRTSAVVIVVFGKTASADAARVART